MSRADAIVLADSLCTRGRRWQRRLGWLMLFRAAGAPWSLLVTR